VSGRTGRAPSAGLDLSDALAPGREIILFDNAGVGRSTGPPGHHRRHGGRRLMLLPDSGHGADFQYVEHSVRLVIDFLDVQPHDTATPA
jgi:hypothetical protein